MQALLPTARLHLARGDHDLARAVARAACACIGDDRLRAAELLTVLVDAELAPATSPRRRRLRRAGRATARRRRRAALLAAPRVRPGAGAGRRAAMLDGRGRRARDASSTRSTPHQLPWLRADVLLELARAHEQAGDRSGARSRRRRPPERSVASTSWSRQPTPSCSTAWATASPSRRPRRRCWRTRAGGGRSTCDGTACGCPTARACATSPSCVARRASSATRWISSTVSRASTGLVDRRALGDAGPVLDGAGPDRVPAPHRGAAGRGRRRARRRRSRPPRPGRPSSTSSSASWPQAFGLGGRDRRAASAAERARLNVTRALRTAITRLAEALPAAGPPSTGASAPASTASYEPARRTTSAGSFSR